MLRTALLWGNTINLDSDYSKYIETVSDPWVIEGFAVENGKVKPGKAWVKVMRSNGESLFVLVQNTQDITVSLNGDVFIGIEVAQNAIDNGLMNNEDGTGIASIKVWPQKPNQNYLLLAVWQGGSISDKREIIPKLQSLSQRTSTLEEKVKTSETKVAKLEDKWTPQYLGKFVEVGEAYQAWTAMVEKGGKLVREAYIERLSGLSNEPINSSDRRQLGQVRIPQGAIAEITIKWIKRQWDFQNARIWMGTSLNGNNLINEGLENTPKNIQYVYSAWAETTLYFAIDGYGSYSIVSLDAIEVNINGNSWLPRLYPREVKGIGERVECTLMGLHSNGEIIQPWMVEMAIGKVLAGEFNSSWNAPSNWYLEFSYKNGYDSAYRNHCWIEVGDERLETIRNTTTKRIYVKKWEITLRWGWIDWYKGQNWLKLLKFSSVM